jgi:hypothetical protein
MSNMAGMATWGASHGGVVLVMPLVRRVAILLRIPGLLVLAALLVPALGEWLLDVARRRPIGPALPGAEVRILGEAVDEFGFVVRDEGKRQYWRPLTRL